MKSSGQPKVPYLISLLGVTGLLLLWDFWGGIPPVFQWLFFAVVVVGWGIPHGAADHLIEARTRERTGHRFSLAGFLLKYLGLILLVATVWWFLPSVSLVLFLVVSALHFGETDLDPFLPNEKRRTWRYLLHGSAVLVLILGGNPEEVGAVLESIRVELPLVLEPESSLWLAGTGFGLWVLSFGFSWAANREPGDLLPLGLLMLLILHLFFLPLKVGFALYFGGVHSMQAFRDIRRHLSSRNEAIPVKELVRKFLPLSCLAVPASLLMIWAGYRFLNPVMLFFIFVAALTVPHFGVMRRLYRSRG